MLQIVFCFANYSDLCEKKNVLVIKEKTWVSLVSESTADKVAIVELAETLSGKVKDETPISVGVLFKSFTLIRNAFDKEFVPSVTWTLILRICMTEKPFIHKKAFNDVETNFTYQHEVK